MKASKTIIGNEPITQEQAMEWLQTEPGQETSTIQRLTGAARAFVENYCGLSLIETEIILVWPNYEPKDTLPYGPVRSVTSITVDDLAVTPDTDYPGLCEYDAGYLKATYTAGFIEIPDDLLQVVYDILKIYFDARSTNVPIPQLLINTLEKHTTNLFL